MITMEKAAKQRREAIAAGRDQGAAELTALMVKNLGPQLGEVYDLLEWGDYTPIARLKALMGINANHLDNLLTRLRHLGLAEREKIGSGLDWHYAWRRTV